MTWSLEGVGHPHRIEVEPDSVLVVGRAADADVIIPDATVSRRHAELRATDQTLTVEDLASSNGTAVNGARVRNAVLAPGDTIAFGKVRYRLTSDGGTGPAVGDGADAGTVVRRLELGPGVEALALAPALGANQQAYQLARLLDLAKKLSGEFELDRLIAAVVDLTFELLPVDRVSLMLLGDNDDLVPAFSKSRLSDSATLRVPRAIARRAVDDRTPIITENAVADERFKSGSVILQAVRGAICTPLLVSKDKVLGALYVDTLTAEKGFTEDEATLLFAFGGLAAVSIGKLRLAEAVEREARARTNFERFFAPEVAARIAASGPIRLGGERRRVTVLFSDIRGFTTLAETIGPDQLSELLTEYFTEMVDLVFEHGGTFDKFIGDAIMAVWGAPLQGADDTDRAVAAALAMQARLATLNQRWRERGRMTLGIGIGLSQGEVFAGYLGSERRLEYSVIGDTVNTAKRLCDQAKAGEVLVTDSVRASLTQPLRLEPLAEIELRGKQQRVGVWRALEAGST